VDSLIERRLINKQTDPDNLSRYQLMLTATGEQLTTGIYETYLAALTVRLQLTPQTIDEALLLLRTVSQQGKLEAQS
jgi:DNA-binding MarR family transcriptional regulator